MGCYGSGRPSGRDRASRKSRLEQRKEDVRSLLTGGTTESLSLSHSGYCIHMGVLIKMK